MGMRDEEDEDDDWQPLHLSGGVDLQQQVRQMLAESQRASLATPEPAPFRPTSPTPPTPPSDEGAGLPPTQPQPAHPASPAPSPAPAPVPRPPPHRPETPSVAANWTPPPQSARATSSRPPSRVHAVVSSAPAAAEASVQSSSARGGALQFNSQPKDPAVTDLAKRLTKALVHYFKSRSAKGEPITWSRLFSEIDVHGTGMLTFESFDEALRGRLQAQASRYELRIFWRKVDTHNTGYAAIADFTRMMYAIELSTWPDLSEAEVERCVTILSTHAEKWHHAGGNWFRIFNAIDTDGSGSLSFDELRNCVRLPFPGLRLKESELPERWIQGLWKLLDANADIEIPTYRFMSFMRKHGSAHSMHKLTRYALRRRGLEKPKETLPEAKFRTFAEHRAIVAAVERCLQAYFAERGLHSNAEGNWARFFKELDSGSGRVSFFELRDGIASRLHKWDPPGQDDIRALWTSLDPEGYTGVSLKELQLALYRLEVDAWPMVSDEVLEAAMGELDAAMRRRCLAGGNWYKAFNMVDKDGSGRLGWHEFKELVRENWGGLAIPPDRLAEGDLKGLWKKLDENLSGDVTVAEFMVFARRYGRRHSMHKLTEYSKRKRGLLKEETQDFSEEIANAPRLNASELCTVATRLTLAINTWLTTRGTRLVNGSTRLWGQLIEYMSPGKPRLSYADFLSACRDVIRIGDLVSDDELRAFWRMVDANSSGEATPMEFDQAVYWLQLESWPKLDGRGIKRIIAVLNAAADKWHRAKGNWYKVFHASDEDNSGTMDFEELTGVFRKKFPGLSVSPKVLSDADLRGFWRALDRDRSGLVDVKEFMVFMRNNGKEFSFQRLTAYSLKARGLLPEERQLGPPPERTRDELRTIARLLSDALTRFWRRRGVTLKVNVMWDKFFTEDGNAAGRLNFWDLERKLRERLMRRSPHAVTSAQSTLRAPSDSLQFVVEGDPDENFSLAMPDDAAPTPPQGGASKLDAHDLGGEELVAKGVTRDDLHALWSRVADVDGSGEVSAAEWRLSLYRLELESWPDSDEAALGAAVDTISAAADKWHRAGGNWYKVFNLVDLDKSGRVGFHEVHDIIRRPLPCLAIHPSQLPDSELKGLWKAMDVDRSGDVNVTEFMVFMRRLEVKRGVSHSPRSSPNTIASRAAMLMKASQDAKDPRKLQPEEASILGEHLAGLSESTFAEAYERWGLPWAGLVSEWDFQLVVRELLGINAETLCDDAIFAAWRSLEGSASGVVPLEALLVWGYN